VPADFLLQHFPLVFLSFLVNPLFVIDELFNFAILHSFDFVLFLLFSAGHLRSAWACQAC